MFVFILFVVHFTAYTAFTTIAVTQQTRGKGITQEGREITSYIQVT